MSSKLEKYSLLCQKGLQRGRPDEFPTAQSGLRKGAARGREGEQMTFCPLRSIPLPEPSKEGTHYEQRFLTNHSPPRTASTRQFVDLSWLLELPPVKLKTHA